MQFNKKIAEYFYLKSRELQVLGQTGYSEYAYRKTAWIIDDLNRNIKEIYEEKGINGLKEIKGIGNIKSKWIEKQILKNI